MGRNILELLVGAAIVVVGGKHLPVGTQCRVTAVYLSGYNLMVRCHPVGKSPVTQVDIASFNVDLAPDKLVDIDR